MAIGGSVTLLPGARVEGDAVAIGGAVSVAEGATLEGDNVSLGGAIPTTVGSMTRWVVGGPHMFSMFSFASRLTRAVLLFVIAVLIAVAFPGALTRIEAYLVNRPGLSALGGVAILLGFVPLCVLLAVTIIGIPLIPVAVMLLVALFLFGFTVSAAWLGERMPVSQEPRRPSSQWHGAAPSSSSLAWCRGSARPRSSSWPRSPPARRCSRASGAHRQLPSRLNHSTPRASIRSPMARARCSATRQALETRR